MQIYQYFIKDFIYLGKDSSLKGKIQIKESDAGTSLVLTSPMDNKTTVEIPFPILNKKE